MFGTERLLHREGGSSLALGGVADLVAALEGRDVGLLRVTELRETFEDRFPVVGDATVPAPIGIHGLRVGPSLCSCYFRVASRRGGSPTRSRAEP